MDDANVSTCTAAANDCTLRGAINAANAAAGDDIISFGAGAIGAPVVLVSALPNLSTNISIQAASGATFCSVRRSTAAGTPQFRIFNITNGSATGPTVIAPPKPALLPRIRGQARQAATTTSSATPRTRRFLVVRTSPA